MGRILTGGRNGATVYGESSQAEIPQAADGGAESCDSQNVGGESRKAAWNEEAAAFHGEGISPSQEKGGNRGKA